MKASAKKILSKLTLGLCTVLSAALLASCVAQPSDKVSVTRIDIKSLQGEYVGVGNTLQLKATIIPDNATDKSITWTSSDETVATVDNGVVTAISESETPVSITATSNSDPKVKRKINIYVVDKVIRATGIKSFTADESTLKVGKSTKLNIVFNPENTTNKKVTYTSSVPACLTIKDGVASVISKSENLNEVTVTATTDDGGFSAKLKITLEDFDESENTTGPVKNKLVKDESFPAKRGICYNHLSENMIKLLSAGNVTWAYNWGTSTETQEQNFIAPGKELEYMPMVWGSPNDDAIAKAEAYIKANPGVKYLLGTNEPNMGGGEGGANSTPRQVAEAWPKMESLAEAYNLVLVSPAMTYSGATLSDGINYGTPESWLDAFISEYKKLYNKNPRMDVIALHSYMAWPASVVQGYCDKYAKMYNKKVMLTEFCAWWDEGQAIDEEWQCVKAAQKIEALDQDDNVLGYAWFKADGAYGERPWNSFYPGVWNQGANRWDYEEKLTKLGLIYTYLSNSNKAKYYKKGESISAVDYVSSCNYQKGKPSENDKYGNPLAYDISDDEVSKAVIPLIIKDLKDGQFMDYQIDVEEDDIYEIRLRYNSNCDKTIYFGSTGIQFPSTNNQWKYYSVELPLKEGKQTLTIKAGLDNSTAENPSCKISWLDFNN